MTSRLSLVLLATTALCSPSASFAASCGQTLSAPNYAASVGGFGTIDGQMYGPDGTPFVPHGIASDLDASTANQILSQFPGINLVRVPVGNMSTNPAQWADAVNILTSHGVVVVFEDHTSSDGQNRGGGTGVEFTGAELAQEMQWYAAMGTYFKNNPYVWATSTNEPSIINASGQTDIGGLVSWQQQLYTAWRASGNNNPFGFSTVGGWMDQPVNPGMATSAYAKNTNTFLDMHFYNGDASFSGSQPAVASSLAKETAQAKQFKSADGTMPVYHFEYGPSSMGPTADPGGMATVAAVHAANDGSAAWINHAGADGSDNLMTGNGLSSFGQAVASYLKTSGAPGCASSPIPVMPTQATSGTPPVVSDSMSGLTALPADAGASGPGNPSIMPGNGAITDASGNQWTISASGSIRVGDQWVDGGGGTAEMRIVNGVVYGRDDGHGPVNAGGWFILSADQKYWTPSQPPPGTASSPVTAPALLPTTAITAPPLLPVTTTMTAPALAPSPLSIEQTAALAARGGR